MYTCLKILCIILKASADLSESILCLINSRVYLGVFELFTAIDSYLKSSFEIRILDTALPAYAVKRSNHYTIETTYSKRLYTTFAEEEHLTQEAKTVIYIKQIKTIIH